ncbi:hypothetical protein [Maribacter sp. Asnod1-A12]|uniref:hypothetical protein n=1 Tax=Maribacter sp. Asnod1-A12 TaxID=3160576 RepID=UPI00386D8B00
MKQIIISILIFGFFGCKNEGQEKDKMETKTENLETLAFNGISIDFEFNSDKPTFGDLFLIVGFDNPNFIAKSRAFEKLNELGFEQTDDFFGIKNDMGNGSDVKIWLFPVINGEEVYNKNGPFDAIRVSYDVLRNNKKTADLFEHTFNSIISNLNVTPTFKGKRIENFEKTRELINKTIKYCEEELKVEPGSDKALLLDW